MGGNQVGDKVLLLSNLFGELIKTLGKPFVHLNVGLSHTVEHIRAAMLRRDLELAAHMVREQLTHKAVVAFEHHVVVAKPGSDKYMLDAGQFPQIAQDVEIFAVVDLQRRAWRGRQTFAFGTQAFGELLFAGGVPKVGRRAAHVADNPLETGVAGETFGLGKDGLFAAAGHGTPLMERN